VETPRCTNGGVGRKNKRSIKSDTPMGQKKKTSVTKKALKAPKKKALNTSHTNKMAWGKHVNTKNRCNRRSTSRDGRTRTVTGAGSSPHKAYGKRSRKPRKWSVTLEAVL